MYEDDWMTLVVIHSPIPPCSPIPRVPSGYPLPGNCSTAIPLPYLFWGCGKGGKRVGNALGNPRAGSRVTSLIEPNFGQQRALTPKAFKTLPETEQAHWKKVAREEQSRCQLATTLVDPFDIERITSDSMGKFNKSDALAIFLNRIKEHVESTIGEF
ncbi:hypothetical protein RhiJN_20041 [Ceratobasidium sp. AG-Ba]|nr:hypothetical protein RhiJN_20041 [Ceratobasidium sp. AG-Ba]